MSTFEDTDRDRGHSHRHRARAPSPFADDRFGGDQYGSSPRTIYASSPRTIYGSSPHGRRRSDAFAPSPPALAHYEVRRPREYDAMIIDAPRPHRSARHGSHASRASHHQQDFILFDGPSPGLGAQTMRASSPPRRQRGGSAIMPPLAGDLQHRIARAVWSRCANRTEASHAIGISNSRIGDVVNGEKKGMNEIERDKLADWLFRVGHPELAHRLWSY